MASLEDRARQMRRSPTPAERCLCEALSIALKEFNAHIKSQEVVGYYIADLMIYPARVVIECDGGHHYTKKGKAYDKRREMTMRNAGIRTLRFPNWRVLEQTPTVVKEILRFCGDFQPKIERTPLGARVVYKIPPLQRRGRDKWRESWFRRIP